MRLGFTRQPAIAEPSPARRQLAKPHAQGVLGRPPTAVDQSLARDLHQPRRPAFAQREHGLRPLSQLAPATGPYNFFGTISGRMCRSSDRSAPSRLSLPFSSRNWRSSRSSLNPSPEYFFFQM